MRYLLDSNILNYLIRGNSVVHAHYERALGADEFILSPVVEYEVMRYFILRQSNRRRQMLHGILAGWHRVALERADWEMAVRLWAERHRAGRPIEDADLLIAVSAIRHGAVLVTNNARHFDGLDLTLENWAAEDAA